MKLKNKKTGEIAPASNIAVGIGKDGKWYDSLADLNAEWEDALEEPKEYWYIDPDANIERTSKDAEYDDEAKQIGNYFSSREEAELAVRKLKAWKRLKDKKYRFSEWFTRVEGGIQINMEYNKYDGIDSECRNDLDLLFCTEAKNE